MKPLVILILVCGLTLCALPVHAEEPSDLSEGSSVVTEFSLMDKAVAEQDASNAQSAIAPKTDTSHVAAKSEPPDPVVSDQNQ